MKLEKSLPSRFLCLPGWTMNYEEKKLKNKVTTFQGSFMPVGVKY
jgi:hypothetical protein